MRVIILSVMVVILEIVRFLCGFMFLVSINGLRKFLESFVDVRMRREFVVESMVVIVFVMKIVVKVGGKSLSIIFGIICF